MREGDSYSYLRRTYTLTREGIYIEPSDQYAKETVRDLGMDSNTKGCRVPGTQKNLLSDEEGQKPLDAGRTSIYASCVMRLLYLAQDRHDIVYTVENHSRTVSKPTEEDWARLKKCAEFLIYRPRTRVLIQRGGGMTTFTATSDSDWAANVETRKSTSCGVLSVDGATQGVYSRGQDNRALSSGESEFYAAGSVLNEAIGLAGIYAEMGFPMTIVLQVDSTAAIGMIQKRGTGRARHIDLRHLHMQDKLRDGTIGALQKIDTSDNVADVGTKYFHAERLNDLMHKLGIDVPDDPAMTLAVVQVSEAVVERSSKDDLLRALQNLVAAVHRAF